MMTLEQVKDVVNKYYEATEVELRDAIEALEDMETEDEYLDALWTELVQTQSDILVGQHVTPEFDVDHYVKSSKEEALCV